MKKIFLQIYSMKKYIKVFVNSCIRKEGRFRAKAEKERNDFRE